MSFFLSEIAEQDIDDIVCYIAQDSTKAAMKLLDALYKTMDNLVIILCLDILEKI